MPHNLVSPTNLFFLYYNLINISLRDGLSKHSFSKQRIKEFGTKSKISLRALFLQGKKKNSPYWSIRRAFPRSPPLLYQFLRYQIASCRKPNLWTKTKSNDSPSLQNPSSGTQLSQSPSDAFTPSFEEFAALVLWPQTRVLKLWCGVTFLPTLQSREPVSPTKRPARNCESGVMKCVETASMPIAFRFKCEMKTATLIN